MASGPTVAAPEGATLSHTGSLGDGADRASVGGPTDYATWFRPELVSLPTNAVVTQATLDVAARPVHDGYVDPFHTVPRSPEELAPGLVDVSAATADWGFADDPQTLDPQHGATQAVVQLATNTYSGSSDVTALVQSWLAGTQRPFGFRLKLHASEGLTGHGYSLPETPTLTIKWTEGVIPDSGTPAEVVAAATSVVRNSPQAAPGAVGKVASNEAQDGSGAAGGVASTAGAPPLSPVDQAAGTADALVHPPETSGPDPAPDPGDNATPANADVQQDASGGRVDRYHRNTDTVAQVLPGVTPANPAEKPLLQHVQLATGPASPSAAAAAAVPGAHGRPNCEDGRYYGNGAGTPVNRSYYCWYSGRLGRAYYLVRTTCRQSGCVTKVNYVGQVQFHFFATGTAYNGSRATDFDIDTRVDLIQNSGLEPGEDVGMQGASLGMQCRVIPQDPAPCATVAGAPAAGSWYSLRNRRFRYSFSSGSYGSGVEKFDTYTFFFRLNFRDQRGYQSAASTQLDSGTNIFRCDSAPYLVRQYSGSIGEGCVFHTSNAVQTVSMSDRNNGVEAQHIYDAYFNPSRTKPTKSNKVVPGALGRAPLTRTLPTGAGTRNARNHDAAVGVCRSVKKNYTDGGNSCDEFPYASTYQGAAVGDNNFSARAISSKQNSSAGGALSYFYATERICDHVDNFFVTVGN